MNHDKLHIERLALTKYVAELPMINWEALQSNFWIAFIEADLDTTPFDEMWEDFKTEIIRLRG